MKRLKIFLAAVILSASANLSAQTVRLSYIDSSGSFYELYNEDGKRYKSLSKSEGELMGFSSTFFIMKRGAYYNLFKTDGRMYKSIPASSGKFISITEDNFILKNGHWIETYDKSGRKIKSRGENQ